MAAQAAGGPAAVDAAIMGRFSARAYLPTPVPRELVDEVLRVAGRAPSGSNTRPWQVYVLAGAARDSLVEQVCAAHDAVRADPALAERYGNQPDYKPAGGWQPPYLERRRENGISLYRLLGIPKGDREAMHRQHQQNYRFFGAPVGLVFSLHRGMGSGSLLDYGTFLQNVMLAARARGLHSCPQGAWNRFARIVLPFVGAGADEVLVCGMALGYADPQAAANQLRTPREELAEFTRWLR